MRADAVLSRYGYCSRREAPQWIRAGRMSYRGEVLLRPADRVEPNEVLVDGAPVPFVNGLYVAFHKPLGCTCSHREEGRLIYDLLPEQWQRRSGGVSSVGRLDKETSGLLLLTDDGGFVHALTSPKRHVPKLYAYECSAPVPESASELFASGSLMLEGETTPCLPAELVRETALTGRLTLHEGRYHQVRRMLAAVGSPVVRLHRLAIGPLSLEELHLAPGEWCAIDPTIFD